MFITFHHHYVVVRRRFKGLIDDYYPVKDKTLLRFDTLSEIEDKLEKIRNLIDPSLTITVWIKASPSSTEYPFLDLFKEHEIDLILSTSFPSDYFSVRKLTCITHPRYDIPCGTLIMRCDFERNHVGPWVKHLKQHFSSISYGSLPKEHQINVVSRMGITLHFENRESADGLLTCLPAISKGKMTLLEAAFIRAGVHRIDTVKWFVSKKDLIELSFKNGIVLCHTEKKTQRARYLAGKQHLSLLELLECIVYIHPFFSLRNSSNELYVFVIVQFFSQKFGMRNLVRSPHPQGGASTLYLTNTLLTWIASSWVGPFSDSSDWGVLDFDVVFDDVHGYFSCTRYMDCFSYLTANGKLFLTICIPQHAKGQDESYSHSERSPEELVLLGLFSGSLYPRIINLKWIDGPICVTWNGDEGRTSQSRVGLIATHTRTVLEDGDDLASNRRVDDRDSCVRYNTRASSRRTRSAYLVKLNSPTTRVDNVDGDVVDQTDTRLTPHILPIQPS